MKQVKIIEVLNLISYLFMPSTFAISIISSSFFSLTFFFFLLLLSFVWYSGYPRCFSGDSISDWYQLCYFVPTVTKPVCPKEKIICSDEDKEANSAKCLTCNLFVYNHHRHAVPLVHSSSVFFPRFGAFFTFAIHLRKEYVFQSSAYKISNSCFFHISTMSSSFWRWFAVCSTWLYNTYINYLTVFFSLTFLHFFGVIYIRFACNSFSVVFNHHLR